MSRTYKFFQLLTFLTVFISALALRAATPVNFQGYKSTDVDTQSNPQRMVWAPQDFAIDTFDSSKYKDSHPDIAVGIKSIENSLGPVPLITYDVSGLFNKNNFSSAGPNTFFDFNYSNKQIHPILQILASNFGAKSGMKDLLVLTDSNLFICYDFDGSSCVSGASPSVSIPGPTKGSVQSLWHANIADYNGDGKNDVVVLGNSPTDKKGFLTFLPGVLDPTQKVYLGTPITHEMTEGYPLSLATGVFNKVNSKLSVMTALMPFNCSSPTSCSLVLKWYRNDGVDVNNNPIFTPVSSGSIAYNVNVPYSCYTPTGLEAKDVNLDGLDDLVTTCYRALPGSSASGPVIVMQNKSGTSPSLAFDFNVLTGIPSTHDFMHPYSSTLGPNKNTGVKDLNGDDVADLVVAENDGYISVFPGVLMNGKFSVDLAHATSFYTYKAPKYVQIADMNKDNLSDVVVSASLPALPVYNIPVGPNPVTATDNQLNFFSFSKSFATKNVFISDLASLTKMLTSQPSSASAPKLKLPLYSGVAVLDTNGSAAQAHPHLKSLGIDTIEDPHVLTRDGILVWLNSTQPDKPIRPSIQIDIPTCDNPDGFQVHCIAGTSPIVECNFSTTNAEWNTYLASNPPSYDINGNNVDRKVLLPQPPANTPYDYLVQAKDSQGNTVTKAGNFTLACENPPGEPGPSVARAIVETAYDCPSKALTIFCKQGSTPISNCTFSAGATPAWLPTPQVTKQCLNGDCTLTVTSPSSNGIYNFTVGIQDGIGSYSYPASVKMNPEICIYINEQTPGDQPNVNTSSTPGEGVTSGGATPSTGVGACPADPESTAKNVVYWDDPWVLCLPSSISAQWTSSGKEIVWQRVMTPEDGGLSDDSVLAEPLSYQGTCISGRYKPDLATEGKTFTYAYSLKGENTQCILKNIRGVSLIEGSGSKCSLQKGEGKFSLIALLPILIAIPLLVFIRKQTLARC